MQTKFNFKSIYNRGKKARADFFEMAFKAVESYATNGEYTILNDIINGIEGSGFESLVHKLLPQINFHKFDRESGRYTNELTNTHKRDHVRANWLDLYLAWQGEADNKERKAATRREAFEIMSDRLDAVEKTMNGLSVDDKQRLYLRLLAMANSLA